MTTQLINGLFLKYSMQKLVHLKYWGVLYISKHINMQGMHFCILCWGRDVLTVLYTDISAVCEIWLYISLNKL